MEFRHLRYFVAVAEELHFGRAAKRLHMAQPPLSQQIRQLEGELGVRLFRRTKRRVELTEEGQVFLPEARAALARMECAAEAARRAGRGEVGRLSVGFVGSAIYGDLPEIVRAFAGRYPEVELSLEELSTAQQVAALKEERIRVGFVRLPVKEEMLACEVLSREPLVAALPEGHRLSMEGRVPLAALSGEPFVIFPRVEGPNFYDRIVGACVDAGFSPKVVQEAAQMQTIVGLVAAGLGVALVPASVENLHRKGVVYRPLEEGALAAEMAVLWRRGDRSAVLRTFLDVAMETASQSATWTTADH